MYLARQMQPLGLKVTRIASGLPVGGDLEYADELTLGSSFRRTARASDLIGNAGGRADVGAESHSTWCVAGTPCMSRLAANSDIQRVGTLCSYVTNISV